MPLFLGGFTSRVTHVGLTNYNDVGFRNLNCKNYSSLFLIQIV